jgi:hypothetical protein
VRYLTIQNGAVTNATNNNPGGLYVQGTGPVVANNIIRGNTSQLSYSGVVITVNGASDASNIHVDNNLIVGNATWARASNVGAASVTHHGTGHIYITNNTISENTGEFLGGLSITGDLVTLSNNVIYLPAGADEACYPGLPCDFYDSSTAPVLLMNNDIGSISANIDAMSSGNVAVNPHFASSNDFHMSPPSPLLGQGLIAPAGGLPSFDIEGHARSYNGTVDMGAYERGDDIFAAGFDD